MWLKEAHVLLSSHVQATFRAMATKCHNLHHRVNGICAHILKEAYNLKDVVV